MWWHSKYQVRNCTFWCLEHLLVSLYRVAQNKIPHPTIGNISATSGLISKILVAAVLYIYTHIVWWGILFWATLYTGVTNFRKQYVFWLTLCVFSAGEWEEDSTRRANEGSDSNPGWDGTRPHVESNSQFCILPYQSLQGTFQASLRQRRRCTDGKITLK